MKHTFLTKLLLVLLSPIWVPVALLVLVTLLLLWAVIVGCIAAGDICVKMAGKGKRL